MLGKDFHRREQDDEQNDETDDFSGQAAGRFSVFAPGTSFRSVASAAFHAAGIARAAGRISVFVQMIGKEQFQFTDGGFHAGDDDAAVDGKSGQRPPSCSGPASTCSTGMFRSRFSKARRILACRVFPGQSRLWNN